MRKVLTSMRNSQWARRKSAAWHVVVATVATALAGLLIGAGFGTIASAEGVDLSSPGDNKPTLVINEALTGRSESLIVVVAGEYNTESSAAAAETGMTLGELQGFYLDKGNNYEVLGAYLSEDPTLEEVRCGSARAQELRLLCSSEGSDLHDGDVVDVRRPVRLKYLPAAPSAVETIQERRKACSGNSFVRPCPDDLVVRVSDSWQLDSDAVYRLTAFRTRAGAEAFVEMVRDMAGIDVTVLRVRKLGGPYIGLGQEPDPDGTGPLLGPLPGQERYQD